MNAPQPALMNNYLIEFYGSRATVDWGEENWRVERELCVSETELWGQRRDN